MKRAVHNRERKAVGSEVRPARRGAPSIPLTQRFWSKVNKAGEVPAHCPELGPCWLWTGTLQRGYGQIVLSRNGATRQHRVWAHRVSWELTHGAIPDGLFALHRCDNPRCVNPRHLFLGTQRDNIDDAIAKGRLTGRPRRAVHTGERKASSPALHLKCLDVESAQ